MLELSKLRFLFVTGKGGVGKSTVSAALALALAQRGKRVLVAATGVKERLSSLLGVPALGPEIAELRRGLYGVALAAGPAIREYGEMKLRSRALASALFDNRIVQGFFAGAPGLKEWALLGKAWYHSIEEVGGAPRFDTVLFDAPSTGHALDMLRVPKVILDVAPPGLLRTDAERAWSMLQDPRRAGVVLVTLAEELPVNETEELYQALDGELGLPVAALVVNGMRPSLFSESDRRALTALLPEHPFGQSLGDAALAAGVRRAERERSQAENRARLSTLGPPAFELPFLRQGATSLEALATLVERVSKALDGAGD